MIRVVHNGNSRQFAGTLDDQFRLRHDIFVKGRGWTEFEIDGIHEKDRYDQQRSADVKDQVPPTVQNPQARLSRGCRRSGNSLRS